MNSLDMVPSVLGGEDVDKKACHMQLMDTIVVGALSLQPAKIRRKKKDIRWS